MQGSFKFISMKDNVLQLTAVFAEIASEVITLEKNNPNDSDFGKKVRIMINEKIKNISNELDRI